MNRFVSPLVLCVSILGPSLMRGGLPPVEIGSRLELLVDDALVDKLEGPAFKFHSPRAAEVALEFNKPWEGSGKPLSSPSSETRADTPCISTRFPGPQ
ncbi:MAG: hypothetical protein Ct9H300mP1_25900 [Planctomycetaceae bacterium]|nr:MAG: hypothetical protein Ct9H300mP1_25900 [Planctomycetaceae bacterium]